MLKHIIYLPFFACLCALAGCSTGYQKIEGQWYFVTWDEGHGTRRNKLDVDGTFRVLENPKFAKDGSAVFFKGKQIKEADAATFQTLDDVGYAKDKSFVFLFKYKIANAHPQMFKVLEYPYSKDDSHVFCGTIPMDVKNVDEFVVVQSNKNIQISSPKYLEREIPGLSFSGDMTIVIGEGEGRTRTQRFLGPYEVK